MLWVAMEDSARKKIKIDNHRFFTEVSRKFKEGCKSVTFTVYGVSMHPFLDSGRDKVVLVPPMQPQVGQVVLAEIKPATYALHRIIKIEEEKISMRGDGNYLSSIEEFTVDKIVGTATGFIRKGKHVSTDSRKWRWYSTAWELAKPMRRCLLAFYRRIIKKYFNI